MRPTKQILTLSLALVLLWSGCSKRIDSNPPVSSAPPVPPSTNPAPAFTVKNENGNWWLVSPAGQKFFSMGVCVITQGSSKEEFDPENPGYAAFQHYASPQKWAEATTQRMRQWGFTTIGAWSDQQQLLAIKDSGLWITPILHMGSTSGLPWWDMWDEKNIARMEEVARAVILASRDDPRLIGYYSDNEMGWWNAQLWKATLDQPASSGQRKKLLAMLRQEYGYSWEKLNQDFESDLAASFDELDQRGMLYLRSGGRGILVMRKWLGLLAERYYSLVEQIIRKYDRRALILGDRYPSFYQPEVVAAAARHVDVISTNLNAAWNDGSFPDFQLQTLHALTRKPVLVTEIYMSAAENRSGNRNSTGNFPVVATQQERARSARNTIERLASLPFVVGMDWFQWADEPTHGRFDGENYNFGLVDIHDRPYEEFVSMIQALNVQKLKQQSAGPRQRGQIPPAPQEPFADFVQFKALKSWDRERGLIPAQTPAPLADLYVCWKPGALYLGLHGWDAIEKEYYRGGSVPKEDRALWSVKIAGREIAKARIGGGREAMVSNPATKAESIPIVPASAWMTAALEIPAKALGKDSLGSTDEIDLECQLITHAGARRMQWKDRLRLIE